MHGDSSEEKGALQINVKHQGWRGLFDSGIINSCIEELADLNESGVGDGMINLAVGVPGSLEESQDRGVLGDISFDKLDIGICDELVIIWLFDIAKNYFGPNIYLL